MEGRVSLFALGLEKVTIYSNREWFNSAEVRFHSIVVADEELSVPGAERIMVADTLEERREIVRSSINQIVQEWKSTNITDIPDRHTFVFGDTGQIVYKSSKIPTKLCWCMLVIDDDTDIRSLGDEINNHLTDDGVNEVLKAIAALASTNITPAAAAGIVLGKELIGLVTEILKGNKDDQIGVINQSFIRPLHYPQGTAHGIGVQDWSGNMWYDYFIYGSDEL